MSLLLYRAPWSTNVQRVRMALAHKGLACDEVAISYDDRSPVEEVSGQGLVPVLVDDGVVVADSMTIVAHLEVRFPHAPLYPAGRAERAELDIFVDWFDRVWKVAPNAIEAELAAGADAARIAAWGAAMARHLDWFEALLDGRDFLLGEYSAADCCAYPFLKYAAARDPEDDERFHVVLDDHQDVRGRPRLAAWIARLDASSPSAR